MPDAAGRFRGISIPEVPWLDEAASDRTQEVTGGRITDRSVIERFRSKYIVDSSGCWIWTDAPDQHGYGSFRLGHRKVRAHRVAYEIGVGPIPEGLTIDHLCRVRLCVNPAHLEAVTMSENVKRGQAARRRPDADTHCCHGHELRAAGKKCRICARRAERKYREGKRASSD